MKHNIIIKHLTYKNFLSTGNEPITINFNASTLISGENGTGKSTVLSALSYVLFSKTDRDIKKNLIINNINGKELLVTLSMIVNGKEVLIERGIKPDILKVYIDGECLNESASKLDFDKKIQDIIGCDYNSFFRLVAISKTNYSSFLNMKSLERRVFIEGILDIEILSTIQKQIKEDVKLLKEEISTKTTNLKTKKSFLERDKERLERTISENILTIKSLENEILSLKEVTIPQLKNKKTQDINNINVEIETLKSKDTKQEQEKIKQEIMKHESVLEDLKIQQQNNKFDQREYDELLLKYNNENKTLIEMEKTFSNMRLDVNIITQNGIKIKEQLDSLKNNSACPMCKKTLSDDVLKNSLETDRNNMIYQYKIKMAALQSYELLLNNFKSDLVKLKDSLEEYKQRKDININIEQRIYNTNNTIKLLQEKDLDSHNNTQIHILNERLNSINNKDYLYEVNLNIQNKEKTITDIQCKKYNDLEESIKKEEMDVIDLEKSIEQLEYEFKHKDLAIKMLDDKGIKSNIIDMYIPFLNERINYYLDKLNLFMYFEIDKNFDEVIKKEHRFECSYNNLSEGEKQRVDLSIMFAFRDIAKSKNYASFNVLFLDDMTGHLDDQGVENVLELITTEQTDIITVMINHDQQKYNTVFDDVIIFEKNNNFTTIKGE